MMYARHRQAYQFRNDNGTSNIKSSLPGQGVQAKKPTLPKGGGALTGFGEQFNAYGFTGAASFSLGGLAYDSSSGNGPFGMGFGAASAQGISRRTSHGTPTYDDDSDIFLWGGDKLVPLLDANGIPVIQTGSLVTNNNGWTQAQTPAKEGAGDYEVRFYRHRTEQDFDRIQYWTWQSNNKPWDAPVSFWRIVESDHAVQLYGVSGAAQIADPVNASRIYRWLHEESLDAEGHCSLIYYQSENTSGVNTGSPSEANREQTAQKYTWRICSGHATPIDEPLSFQTASARQKEEPPWFFETVYDYGEYDIDPANTNPYAVSPGNAWSAREDAFSTFVAGFEIRTHRLCRHVLEFHRFPELGGNPVLTRATRYSYDESPTCSLLTTVEEIGYYQPQPHAPYQTRYTAPLEIGYTGFKPTAQYYREIVETASGQPFPGVGNGLPFTPVDLYNEGIEGFLYSDGISDYYLQADWDAINNDDATSPLTFSRQPVQMPLPLGRLRKDAQHTLVDVTANGQLDYLISAPDLVGFYERQPDRSWCGFQPLPQHPPEDFNPRRHMVDVTGDGIDDCVMVLQQGVRYYPNLREGGFGEAVCIDRSRLPDTFPVSLESSPDTLLLFLDLDGGGRSHLARISCQGLSYWPNYGYGLFGEEIKMDNFPVLKHGEFSGERVLFGDVDGSGTMDMLVLHSDKISLYLNQCGNRFQAAIDLPLPAGEFYDPLDRILFADVYGTGLSCLIYCKTHPAPRQWCYPLCGDTKPYLLNGFTDNRGGQSRIRYKSSVHDYLEDKANGVAWFSHAPFPTQVVDQVQAMDGISGSTETEQYRYRHGYYDGTAREFRGFGYVSHQDTQTFDPARGAYDSPPSLTKTWYCTGSPDQNSLSKQYQSEYFNGDPKQVILADSQIDYGNYPQLKGNADIEREAQTVLKGTALRIEVYGLDGSASQSIPYAVTEQNRWVKLLQPKDENAYAVFMPLPRESLSYRYERNPDDPAMAYRAALQFDDYGHVLQSCDLIYGRRRAFVDPLDRDGEQGKIRAHSPVALYANLTDAGTQIGSAQAGDELYLLGIPYDHKTYLITNIEAIGGLADGAIYGYDELQSFLAAHVPDEHIVPFSAKTAYELLGWRQDDYLYPVDGAAAASPSATAHIDTIGLNRGSVRAFLLHCRTRATAYKQADLLSNDLLGEFFDQAGLSSLMQQGHYLSNGNDEYWWAQSGHYSYGDSAYFYLPQKYTDPAGSATSFAYDAHNLLMTASTDALNNQVKVEDIDYQTLHPDRIVDINGNTEEVLFDPLGRVIATSHYGGETRWVDGQETYQADVGFYSLYGQDTHHSPYRDQPAASMAEILASPYTYLQNAERYFYYDDFSWMGQVTQDDYKQQIAGISESNLADWWQAMLASVLINDAGALYRRFHKLIAGAADSAGFVTELGAQSAALQTSFTQFSADQQDQIFALLTSAISPTAVCPVHVLSLGAEDYPDDSQARLTQSDYRNAIAGIDEEALDTWWQALQTHQLIDAQGVFSGAYRQMVQQSASVAAFQQRLGAQSADLQSAFDGFPTDQQSGVFTLQQQALYRRIDQAIDYFDGFGRGLQSKTKAEDGADCFLYDASTGQVSANSSGDSVSNRWLTSGHIVYNNKGEVVRAYEPYFIDTTEYVSDDNLNHLGASPTSYYDPLGRVTHAITNKGFLLWHQWTAWDDTAWDANDTLPFSPFYLVNRENILHGNTTPPNKGSPYYRYIEYFEANMRDAEREAYKKATLCAWTPERHVEDNRGLTLCGVAMDDVRFTAGSFSAIGYGQDLVQNLIEAGYLVSRQSAQTRVTGGETIRQSLSWGQLTPDFPFPILAIDDDVYLVQSPRILNILFQHKLNRTPVSPNDLSAAGFTALQTQALWTLLGPKPQGIGILDSDGGVTDQLAFPVLDKLDAKYQPDNDAIVSCMIENWAGGRNLNTFNNYDDRGRLLTRADARLSADPAAPSVNITYDYPATLGDAIHVQSCDAGQRWNLHDALDRPLWDRDARAVIHRYDYDALHRPTAIAVSCQPDADTPPAWGPVTVQRFQYGEALTDPEKRNLRGRLVQHFDQSAWAYVADGYNILGLPLGGTLQLTKAYKPQDPCDPPAPLVAVPALGTESADLPNDPDHVLQTTAYRDHLNYDALGRIVQSTDTAGNSHRRFYHQSGPLQQAMTNGTPYIDDLVYNAKGQRTRSACFYAAGKLVYQTYQIYDPKNYRNTQIYSTVDPNFHWTDENQVIDTQNAATRQNLVYTFDPVGNVATLSGNYQGPAAPSSNLSGTLHFPTGGTYEYDALYRLIVAGGYEQVPAQPSAPTTAYTRRYGYDDGDNLTLMQHYPKSATSPSYAVNIYTAGRSNRAIDQGQYDNLTTAQRQQLDQALVETGLFDVHGNQLQADEETVIRWDYDDRILAVHKTIKEQGPDQEYSAIQEYYVYTALGERARKITELLDSRGNITVLRVVSYLDVEYRGQWDGDDLAYDGETVTDQHGIRPSPESLYQSLRIREGHRQVARVDHYQYAEGHPDDFQETVFYLDNHIDSCQLLLDQSGQIKSYEEYYPYGGTAVSVGNLVNKHYGYSGQEQDATGFHYYGLRYYYSANSRWLCPDPAGFIDGLNLYAMVGGNPITHRDRLGLMHAKVVLYGARGGQRIYQQHGHRFENTAALNPMPRYSWNNPNNNNYHTEVEILSRSIREQLPGRSADYEEESQQLNQPAPKETQKQPKIENKKIVVKLTNEMKKIKSDNPIIQGPQTAVKNRVKAGKELSKGHVPGLDAVTKGVKVATEVGQFYATGGVDKITTSDVASVAGQEIKRRVNKMSLISFITAPIQSYKKTRKAASVGVDLVTTNPEEVKNAKQELNGLVINKTQEAAVSGATGLALKKGMTTSGQVLLKMPHPYAKVAGGLLIAGGHTASLLGGLSIAYKFEDLGNQYEQHLEKSGSGGGLDEMRRIVQTHNAITFGGKD